MDSYRMREKLQALFKNDKEMLRIDSEIAKLQEAKVQRRAAIGRKEKFSLCKLEELCCTKHPDSGFDESRIPRLAMWRALDNKNETDYHTYVCKECKKQNKNNSTQAYECPKCGIVYGEPVEANDFHVSTTGCLGGPCLPRVNGESTTYSCIICSTQLGYNYLH